MGTMRMKGGPELLGMLGQVPRRLETNIARGGVRATSAVFRDDMKGRVEHLSGELAAGIKVKSPRRKGDLVSGGVGLTGDHAFVGLFLEDGVGAHEIVLKLKGGLSLGPDIVRAKVEHPGFGPHPFMGPSFDLRSIEAANAFGSYAAARLSWAELQKPVLQVADFEPLEMEDDEG
jgi:hypothetical protein